MEIREIIYIHAVAETSNLTKAAALLHITQPSLSQSIKNIEKTLGLQLFIRSKKGMTLTDYGNQFIKDSTPVLNEYRQLESKLDTYTSLGNTYHIGLFKLIHTTPINDAIMSYIGEHNDDNYMIKVDTIEHLESMVENGQLDMAIIKYSPLVTRNPLLDYTLLCKQSLCVMFNKMRLEAPQDVLTMDTLKGLKLLTSAKNEYPYQMIQSLIDQSPYTHDILVSTNYSNMNVITHFIEKDLGVTFATEDVCKYYSNSLIDWRPFSPSYSYDICIVQNKQKIKNKADQLLIDFIKGSMLSL